LDPRLTNKQTNIFSATSMSWISSNAMKEGTKYVAKVTRLQGQHGWLAGWLAAKSGD
jgi:hypothetical protein